MLLFFYWYLAHCQSVTELANNTPKIHEIFRGPRMLPPSASAPQNATSIFGDPASNLLNKNYKIIINQFIEVTLIRILLKIGLKSYIIAKKFAYIKINEYLCIENMSMQITENPLPYCITLTRST